MTLCNKIKIGTRTIQIPDLLQADLDIFYDDMTLSSMDVVLVIDGKEGTGKSVRARTIGAYFSHKSGLPFDSDNIHLTTDDYIKASDAGVKYQVNVLDESRMELHKMRAMSSSHMKFTNYLSENRDKHQVHIVLLPAVHDLANYITMWRMSLLIHMLKFHRRDAESPSGWKLKRGYCRVYENNKDLQQVIFNKAKFGYYAYPKYYKYQRLFPYKEIFNTNQLETYNNKKATKRTAKYAQEPKNLHKEHLKTAIEALKGAGLSNKEISEKFDRTPSWVSKIVGKPRIVNSENHI